MKLKALLLLAYICFIGNAFAQKEGNNWYFGNKAGITFNTSPPSALTNGQLFTTEGCATISTPGGRLLFYTDGITVWDSTHNAMPNGTGLKGNSSSTQSGVIVPRPDSAHIFYIFTVDDVGGPDGLQYSEVNMKLNNGKGNIVSAKKNIKLKNGVCEKITAIQKSNGKDLWVLTVKLNSDSVFAYSVTNAGVNHTPVGYKSGMVIKPGSSNANAIGYLKISADGKKVAYANYQLDTCVVADFNTKTGTMSNVWSFYSDDAYGVEFSPKSKFLYIGEFGKNTLTQYDLSATTRSAFIASRNVVDTNFGNNALGALQLAPDGKIYISIGSSTYNSTLSVIHAPDSLKKACRPQRSYISLSTKTATYGLPTFIQSYFQRKTFTVKRNCVNDTTQFTLSDLSGLDSVRWNFGDPGSGSENVSNKIKGVTHIYQKTGFYDITLISFFNNSKQDTVKVTYYIKNPKPRLGRDTSICNKFSMDIRPHKNYLTYKWSNNATTASIAVTKKGTYIVKVKDTAECLSADTIVVSNPKTLTGFTLSDTLQCLTQNSFTMHDTTVYKDDAWLKSTWYFGDGNNKVDTMVKKVYQAAGTYYIKLVLQSKQNCRDSISKKIVVNPSAVVGFNINKETQCFKGNSFRFDNTSNVSPGNITSYKWDFGDGGSSTNKDIPVKSYSKDSTYLVRLIVTTDKGCKDTAYKNITIHPNPVVKYTESKTSQCFKNNSVNFSNGTTIRKGTVVSYKWTFGDGNQSANLNINNKKYTTEGVYDVMLLAVSDKGCRDSLTKKITIFPNTSIGYTINKPVQCFNGNSFDFTNGSTISSGTISFFWTFGDDSTSIKKDISNRPYLKDTVYKVTLYTTSDRGCKDTLQKTAIVNPNPVAKFNVVRPVQCFNYNKSLFPNQSSITKGSIATNNWNFGDSTTSSQKDISNKAYSRPDTFDVSLLVISDKGCRDSVTQSVIINPNATIGFTIDKDTQCYEWHKFNYTNTTTISKGLITGTDWLLGDGSSASFRDIKNKIYNSYGNYTVQLSTISDKGCKDTFIKSVMVKASPITTFAINKDRQCFRGNSFSFTNQSAINNGSIVNTEWDLGNMVTSGTKDISNHSYTTEDTFFVRLISISDKGCRDTARRMVVTFAQPVAKFIVPNDSQCWQNNFFIINNFTTLKYGKLNNTWAFGDGTFDNSYKPQTKKYANKSSSYTIRYTAVSDHGCTDSAKHRIVLMERPISEFTINDSVQCFRTHLFSFVNKTTFSAMNTLSYYWDYGNGNQSTGITPQTATYPNAQYYDVRLISYSSLTNCYDTVITKVLPAPHAIPDYNINLDSQCLRLNQYSLSNLSTLSFGTMSYKWTFNDNTYSTFKNPVKHYTAGANYNIKLVVTTNQGCSDSITKPVVLVPHPKANFVINDSTQCLNSQLFDFTNTTTIPYGKFTTQWWFDDATQSSNKDVNGKRFTTGYRHKILMEVNSNHNCKDTFIQTVYLEVPKGSAALQLTENDSQCLDWNKFSFSTVPDPGIVINNWKWLFGDGSSSLSPSPAHHYDSTGNYNILVETISSVGCYDTAYTKVTLLPHPVSDYIADSVCFPEPIYFKDKSIISTGTIVSYYWAFGNEITSAITNPRVFYKKPGHYNITLITASNYGCLDTLERVNGAYIRVKPKASFSYNRLPSRQAEMINLQMNNQSSSDVVINYWQFDNGYSSTQRDPQNEYTDTGKKWISLIVTNDVNCMDTFRLQTVSLFPDFFFYLPNAFRPSEGGVNTIFKPVSSVYVSYYNMEIYNRWGEKLFETSDITKGWDGTYKTEPVQQDVYLCRIYLIPINGKKQFHEISVTVLR